MLTIYYIKYARFCYGVTHDQDVVRFSTNKGFFVRLFLLGRW
jgi:hypothetical protein